MDPVFRSTRLALNERAAALVRASRITCERLEARGGATFENLRATLERAEEIDIEGAAHGFLLLLAEDLERHLRAAERLAEADSVAHAEEQDPLALVGSLEPLVMPPRPINPSLGAARHDDAQRRLNAEFVRLERIAGGKEGGRLRILLNSLGYSRRNAYIESFEKTPWGWQGSFRTNRTLYRIVYSWLTAPRITAAVKISVDAPASAPTLSLHRRRLWQMWSKKGRYTDDDFFNRTFLITSEAARERVSALFSAQQRERLEELRHLSLTIGIVEEAAHIGWSAGVPTEVELFNPSDTRKAIAFLHTLSADLWPDQA